MFILSTNNSGECVRLKNNVINAEILDNTIYNCGIHDYEFESEDKNGEGIYIGTSSNQASLVTIIKLVQDNILTLDCMAST